MLGERRGVGVLEQTHDRAIDMRAVSGDLRDIGTRDQAALRTRMPRAGGHVIGIEQKAEALVEHPITGTYGLRRNCSKNHVVCARCHLVGLASGIDWTT